MGADAAATYRGIPAAVRYAARMGTASLRLFRVAGIDVFVHVSWLAIFGLVTWSLAVGYYPQQLAELSGPQAWTLGALSAILLFGSVLLHELAHSLVAKTRGIEAASITLFIFGGVSSLRTDAPRASTEFVIAIVGPLTSFVLAGACLAVSVAVGDPRVDALFGYLALINGLLGGFNLIPGFPLDGGRVLRAIVWQLTGSMRRGLEVAAGVGQLVAYAFMVWGVLQVLGGDAFNGIWIAVIGWFLQGAGAAQLRQVRSEERLTGVTVGDVMRVDASAIGPNASVADLVEDYLVPGNRRAVPVVLDDRLVGMVTLGDIQAIPATERAVTRVADVMGGRDGVTSAAPGTPLVEALEAMLAGDFEQLPVLADGRLVGVLSRADIVRQIQLREALHLQ
jgi:Zn-dependent protease/CBS domain-containing protein